MFLAIGIVVSVLAISYDLVVFPEFGNGIAASYLVGVALAVASLFILYEAWATNWRGQSLGKRNVGLKVLRISDGQAPPLLESFARTAIPPATCLCVYGIATAFTARWPFIYGAATWAVVVLSPLLDVHRRSWHDKWTRTVVVKRASERGNSRRERRRMTLALEPRRRRR